MSVSKSEQLFLNQLIRQEQQVFNTAEVRHFWGTPENTDNALSRLRRKQQIIRLSRGLYALPSFHRHIQSNRFSELCQIASHLVPDAVLAYQTAMCVYDPALCASDNTRWYIQTTHRKRDLTILGLQFVFIQLKPAHYFDILPQPLENGQQFAVTKLEKTMIDGANHPEYVGGIPRLAQFIQTFARSIDWQHLHQAAITMQNGTIIKRLGYLIDRFQIIVPNREAYLEQLHAAVTQGVVLLDPKREQRGHIHTRWEIEDNVFDCKDGAA
jgi:predicted transcriptional regulator of viral defense system